jgi:hypothetical protein
MNTIGLRVNFKTGTVSQYAGLGYNSLASVSGVLVGADSSGLSTMIGDSLTSYFETHHSDLKNSKSKRVRTVILSGEFEGGLDVTTVLDGVETETVRVYSEDAISEKNYVIKFSSVNQGMYVGIKVANVAGADYSIHQIAIVYTSTDSKWGTSIVLGRLKTTSPFPTVSASGE